MVHKIQININTLIYLHTYDPLLCILDIELQDILVFSEEELSILYTTSTGIGLYDTGIDLTIKDGIVVSSVRAQQFDNQFLIGFVDDAGKAGLIHYDIDTQTVSEFSLTTSFTPTEVQPWRIPQTDELVVVAIGSQNLAYGYAAITFP